jgi:hypothetical protein
VLVFGSHSYASVAHIIESRFVFFDNSDHSFEVLQRLCVVLRAVHKPRV